MATACMIEKSFGSLISRMLPCSLHIIIVDACGEIMCSGHPAGGIWHY